MRFTLTLEDADGNQICMTDPASTGIMTSEIEGLSPPAGTLSTAGYAGSDGSYLTNAYVDKRNIVISFQIRGASSTIEERRQNLYDIVQPGQYIKVYYKTTRRNVYTEGYVESVTVSNFSAETGGQISILCPDIYWHAVDEGQLSVSTDMWEIEADASADSPQIAGIVTRVHNNSGVKTAFALRCTNTTGIDMVLSRIVLVCQYESFSAETFTFPAGAYIDLVPPSMAKYARIYDSGGNHVTTLVTLEKKVTLPIVDRSYGWGTIFTFASGTITDDEMATILENPVTIEVTPYTTYLGV